MEEFVINKISMNISVGVFLADIHFGLRLNSEEWLFNHEDYFNNFFIPYLKKIVKDNPNESVGLFILGDINDNRKAIDINVSNKSFDIIEALSEICPVIMLTGNHDLSKKTNQGNNSLRPFSYQSATVISAPTEITLNLSDNITKKIIAIPYMGSFNEETKYLIEYKDKAEYALMHTELNKMKMDNGMAITAGVNTDVYNGLILSGHIHKQQKTKKCVYVGSPFQMSRGDIGNQKGVYTLNFKTGTLSFHKNNYSPVFQNIDIDDFLKMDITQRQKVLNNNYNYIVIPEEKLNAIRRKIDIYNLKEGTTARCARPIINRSNKDISSTLDISTGNKEKTIEELIIESIDNLEIEDSIKEKVRSLNKDYFKAAIAIQTGKE